VQSDWGGECQGLQRYLTSAGIHHRVACPHTHQQNGVVERKHRHIVKIGLALLAQSSLPLRFWDEAFLSACYLINRLPTKTLENLTPFEKLLNKKPAYTDLKVFGCACWPHLRPYTTPNSHLDPCNVCSWDTIACIRATSVSMCHLIGFTFPVMGYLMKAIFRLPLNLILLPHQYLNTSFFLHCMPLFLLTNMLYGLYYHYASWF
jgi:hypothetical protein